MPRLRDPAAALDGSISIRLPVALLDALDALARDLAPGGATRQAAARAALEAGIKALRGSAEPTLAELLAKVETLPDRLAEAVAARLLAARGEGRAVAETPVLEPTRGPGAPLEPEVDTRQTMIPGLDPEPASETDAPSPRTRAGRAHPEAETIVAELRALRDSGVQQKDIAAGVGLAPSALSRWFSGERRPDPERGADALAYLAKLRGLS